METSTKADVSYVVRDDSGRVVVIFAGSDAPTAASEWAARGYEVTPTVLRGDHPEVRRAVS